MFSAVSLGPVKFSLSENESYFMTENSFFKIVNILKGASPKFICHRFVKVKNVYREPFPSREIGIVTGFLSTVEYVAVSFPCVHRKVLCLPFNDRFILFPLQCIPHHS